MTRPVRLDFSARKAEYLLRHATEPGEGGDKQMLFQGRLGFDSADAIREAILTEISLERLELQEPNQHGDRYYEVITITGPSGVSCRLRTVWIVLLGEDVAKFVTAVPMRRNQR